MGRWGRVNFQQLERLQRKMQKLERANFDQFCEEVAKELAARLLGKVVRRTPVGQYDDGRVGGTLRRGWTIDANVTKRGHVYEIEVFNPVDYSQYVEFGHRTRNHQGWVNGRFMMTISADEVELQAPNIVENKLKRLLGDAFDGS